MEIRRTLLLMQLCCTLAAAFNNAAISPHERRNSPLQMQAEDSSRRVLLISMPFAANSIYGAAANAVYGADANIQMPNIAQGMADRANKQCLVESLGNRECLVYEDPDNKLYKSADNKILLKRLGTSVEALKRLPSYIENKQWSNVQSVLTGPMGSLSYTQNELVKLIDEENPVKKIQCRDLTGNIRKDLYAISAAIGAKDGKQALINYERASEKLEKFVKLVSSV